MNVRTVQHSMLKRAGLFGNTMLGRWITDTMGPHTFVSDALGASALDMIDHQAKTQLGWNKPTGGSPNDAYGQEYARAQQRLNEGLAKAQQRQAAARQKQLAQQQAQASRNNERLMAAYMAGNNQQLAKQNQRAVQGRAITNRQLVSARSNALVKVQPQRQQQVRMAPPPQSTGFKQPGPNAYARGRISSGGQTWITWSDGGMTPADGTYRSYNRATDRPPVQKPRMAPPRPVAKPAPTSGPRPSAGRNRMTGPAQLVNM